MAFSFVFGLLMWILNTHTHQHLNNKSPNLDHPRNMCVCVTLYGFMCVHDKQQHRKLVPSANEIHVCKAVGFVIDGSIIQCVWLI